MNKGSPPREWPFVIILLLMKTEAEGGWLFSLLIKLG